MTTETAKTLVALLDDPSNPAVDKVRISERALKQLAGIDKLHFVFLAQLKIDLSILGWSFEPLYRGGFGLLRVSSMENAPFFKLFKEDE